MCFPSLQGGIEVEERYRKHKDGPRHKRLFFVKNHSSARDSDEWQLVTPRREMREPPRPVYPPQWAVEHARRRAWQDAQMHHQIPAPPLHHQQPEMGFHGEQHRLPHHPHQDPGDDIVPVIEDGPHNAQHYQVQFSPKVVEVEPRSKMPPHLQPTRGRGHSRHSSGSNSLFSGSSHGGSHHGGRGRRRSAYSDDDSFQDRRIEPRTRRIHPR